MTRRSMVNDYSLPGMYHITLHVADEVGHPFGCVVGDAALPYGSDGAPHTQLSPVGQMVKHELLNSIRSFYPMIEVQDYVIMPEHMHFIVEVHEPIVSRQGRKAHLGQVIAGFKKGCNRRYWELTEQNDPSTGADTRRGKPAGTEAGGAEADTQRGKPAGAEAGGAEADTQRGKPAGTEEEQGSCPAVFPQEYKVPSTASTGRQPLFASGYVDVMPLRSGQLQQQRQYIRNNPRSRLLRSTYRDLLQPQRGGIDTSLTVKALMRFLRNSCPPRQITAEKEALIEGRLLTTDTRRGKPDGTDAKGTEAEPWRGKPAGTDANGTEAEPWRGKPAGTDANGTEAEPWRGKHAGTVDCDSYGSRELLKRRMLPVVCHRRDKARFEYQKAQCLKAAQEGAVLVSARIAEGEQEIIDECVKRGFPVIIIADNGFPDIYHPSAERMELCLANQLLIVTPWQYHYRNAEQSISVAECKTMNCVAQALCRKKDEWWRENQDEKEKDR